MRQLGEKRKEKKRKAGICQKATCAKWCETEQEQQWREDQAQTLGFALGELLGGKTWLTDEFRSQRSQSKGMLEVIAALVLCYCLTYI